MKKNLLQKMIFGAALLLAAGGCTQDDDLDGNTLPEGKYPLEIASVSLSAEVTDEPWGASQAPQTRVAENPDGNSSHWEAGDEITVELDGKTTTYRINSDGSSTTLTGNPLYWKNAQQTTVTAWYPPHDEGQGYGTIKLNDQSDKLAYVLKGSGLGKYDDPVTLSFTHALAKVRVVVQGGDASKVTDVKIWSNTSCTHTNGADIKGSGVQGWIIMNKIDKGGGTKYWEANVVPNAIITELQVNENSTPVILNGNGITPLAAKINTITLTAGEMTYDLNDYTAGGTINVTGKATITGSSPTKQA